VIELAQHIVAYVAETCVLALRSIFIASDFLADTTRNIGLQNVHEVLTAANFDEEAAPLVPDLQEALLDLHLAPPLVQLAEGGDAIIEPWNIEDTDELD
jgi:hypothetical protein